MADVTIATVKCDSSIAVAVVKDFLRHREIDVSAISTAADAKTALEAELKRTIRNEVVAQRMTDDGNAARATSQTANLAAVILS